MMTADMAALIAEANRPTAVADRPTMMWASDRWMHDYREHIGANNMSDNRDHQNHEWVNPPHDPVPSALARNTATPILIAELRRRGYTITPANAGMTEDRRAAYLAREGLPPDLHDYDTARDPTQIMLDGIPIITDPTFQDLDRGVPDPTNRVYGLRARDNRYPEDITEEEAAFLRETDRLANAPEPERALNGRPL